MLLAVFVINDRFKAIEFAIKKLGFTDDQFQAYLKAPAVPHSNYAMSISLFDEIPALKPFKKLLGK